MASCNKVKSTRRRLADAEDVSELTFRRLQTEQRPWVQHNFGDRPGYWPLLGIVEELGELAHAHLKAEQGIRVNEDHAAKKRDAVADIIIYVADYCSAEGIDLQATVESVWAEVKRRDWKADKANAAEKARLSTPAAARKALAAMNQSRKGR